MVAARDAGVVLELLEGFPHIMGEEPERTQTLASPLKRNEHRAITPAAQDQTLLCA